MQRGEELMERERESEREGEREKQKLEEAFFFNDIDHC